MLRLVMEARHCENFRMGPPGWSDDSDSEHEDMTDEQLPADLLEVFLADDTSCAYAETRTSPKVTAIRSTSYLRGRC